MYDLQLNIIPYLQLIMYTGTNLNWWKVCSQMKRNATFCHKWHWPSRLNLVSEMSCFNAVTAWIKCFHILIYLFLIHIQSKYWYKIALLYLQHFQCLFCVLEANTLMWINSLQVNYKRILIKKNFVIYIKNELKYSSLSIIYDLVVINNN